MTCPFFMPVEKLDNGNWPHPSRLPLGAGWRGHCTASGHEGELPPQHVLEAFCNLGYADGCTWAPRERVWDAVRFAPSNPADRTAGSEAARAIQLLYVCERNHAPVENGILEFDVIQRSWTSRHDDPRIQKMAECFLESWLKKKS